MLPDGGAVRTPPVEFADGVFPGGSRMEPLLLIRKNGGYPLDFLCPVRLGPGLAGFDDDDRTGWRAKRLKFANIAKAGLSHQHREKSIGIGPNGRASGRERVWPYV